MDDISAVPKTVDELVIFRCGVQISLWNLSCYNKHLLGLFLANRPSEVEKLQKHFGINSS